MGAVRRTPRRGGGGGRGGLAVLLVILVAAPLALFWLRERWLPEPPPPPAPLAEPEAPFGGEEAVPEAPPAPPEAPAAPAPATEEALPALDASDAWVRDAARGLSARADLPRWLAADDLVRRFVAAVDNVAEGLSPREHLAFLAPSGPYRALEREGRAVPDPAGFRRYDAFAAAFASLDTEAGVALYRRARPLVEEAWRALGGAGGFDARLRAALGLLLETPLPTGDEELERPGVVWRYRDERLEGLAPAQKHLLRLGPGNAARVRAKLAEVAERLDAGG
jgi:hypothetical protein